MSVSALVQLVKNAAAEPFGTAADIMSLHAEVADISSRGQLKKKTPRPLTYLIKRNLLEEKSIFSGA
jgi:hypothetical protein